MVVAAVVLCKDEVGGNGVGGWIDTLPFAPQPLMIVVVPVFGLVMTTGEEQQANLPGEILTYWNDMNYKTIGVLNSGSTAEIYLKEQLLRFVEIAKYWALLDLETILDIRTVGNPLIVH